MSKNKTVSNVFFLVFCLFACVSLARAESCSLSGQVQYKYTANGCSYDTIVRTCAAQAVIGPAGGKNAQKLAIPQLSRRKRNLAGKTVRVQEAEA